MKVYVDEHVPEKRMDEDVVELRRKAGNIDDEKKRD